MGSDTDSEGLNEQQDFDDWTDDESGGFKSLLQPDQAFGSLEEALQHDAELGFSLRQFRAQHALDHYDTIRCINYVRGEVAAGRDPLPALRAAAAPFPWAGDTFLAPVLPDDELLFHDWEEEDEAAGAGAGGAAGTSTGDAATAAHELAALRRENADLRAALEALQAVVLADDAVRELVADAAADGSAAVGAAAAADGQGPSGSGAATSGTATAATAQPTAEREAIDASYFDSYSTWHIHHDMLADRARTEAYRDALERNPALIRGARVLDVGCGTGILSMFAARGGAAAVVGVDGSAPIAAVAQGNVEANGLATSAGGPIAIVHSRVEQLTMLPLPGAAGAASAEQQQQQQVDVLVSEWMGYALFFESMLDSVLAARDKFLRPGGALLPDLARVYLAPASAAATGIPFWRDVYGFDMPGVAASLHASQLHEVVVRTVPPTAMLGEGAAVASFDLATMRAPDQDFTADFRLTVSQGPTDCAALVLWFDTLFSERFCREHPVTLDTSPFTTPTHWGQAVLTLKAPVVMVPAAAASLAAPGAAVALAGKVSMARSKHKHRSLDIALSYAPVAPDGSVGETVSLLYSMGVNG